MLPEEQRQKKLQLKAEKAARYAERNNAMKTEAPVLKPQTSQEKRIIEQLNSVVHLANGDEGQTNGQVIPETSDDGWSSDSEQS